MPADTFTFFDNFALDALSGVHDFNTPDDFKVALTNTAPNTATNTVLSDITQIATSGGYTSGAGGGVALAGESVTEASGTSTVTATDLVITASGGSIGPFRYFVVYNNTPTSPADPLIGTLDYGSALTLADGESVTIDIPAGGLFTAA